MLKSFCLYDNMHQNPAAKSKNNVQITKGKGILSGNSSSRSYLTTTQQIRSNHHVIAILNYLNDNLASAHHFTTPLTDTLNAEVIYVNFSLILLVLWHLFTSTHMDISIINTNLKNVFLLHEHEKETDSNGNNYKKKIIFPFSLIRFCSVIF